MLCIKCNKNSVVGDRYSKTKFLKNTLCQYCVKDELKLKIFNHYSNNDIKCICCNERNLMFLTIDHINNDGAKHRKQIREETGNTFYLWLKDNNYPEGFQVLCYNCNIGKYRNKGICPHNSKG